MEFLGCGRGGAGGLKVGGVGGVMWGNGWDCSGEGRGRRRGNGLVRVDPIVVYVLI